jgi:O-succinylbenzoic acid--CoA ligase
MTSELFDFKTYIDKYRKIPFILSDEMIVTYQEFGSSVNQVANRLKINGIVAGDFIALVGEANPQYVIFLFALFQVGAVAVLLNPEFPQSGISELMIKINCTKYIGNEKIHGDFQKCGDLQEDLDRLENSSFKESDNKDIRAIPLKQEATVIFTSGSSGESKAVLHTLGNHYYSALGSNDNIKVNISDRWLLVLPVFHVGGLAILFRSFIAGGSFVMTRDRRDLVKYIEQYNITHLSLVPTQLYRLLISGISLKIYRRLKAVLLGGDKIPTHLIAKAIKYSLPVFTTYGSTEMSSQITTTRPGESITGLKTWTGDIGSMDKNGYLTVHGRKDNMFISGGENIHPEEIEEALNNTDTVMESLVVGVDDDEFGMLPVAFIRTKNKELPPKDIISENLLIILPKYKLPKFYFSWPDEEENMKPNRIRFKKLAKQLLTGD